MILNGTFLSVVLADGVANIEKKAKDRKAILQMAGCFTVDFYFEEINFFGKVTKIRV